MSDELQLVVDVDTDGFQREVVDRSVDVPVLVDLWAEWCGPCKSLGPVLEKVVADYGGGFVLAKVDVDKAPEVSKALGVQSVPTVFLLVDGRPVDAFSGTVTEGQLIEFLTKNGVKKREGDGVGEAEGEGEDAGPIGMARGMCEDGDEAGAIAMLAELHGEEALDLDGVLCLVELMGGAGDAAGALGVLDGLEGEDAEDARVAELRAKLAIAGGPGVAECEAAVAADPQDAGAQLDLGKALVAAGRVEEGLDTIWMVARVDLEWDGGRPREALVEVFGAIGHDDPRVLSYQQRLSVLLCS